MARKIEDCSIEELEALIKNPGFSDEQRKIIMSRIKELKAKLYGVDDMGYPYKTGDSEGEKEDRRPTEPHVDMYQGSVPLGEEQNEQG